MAKVKDDLGIELDEDVAEVLKDPKSSVLMRTLDYRDSRKAKEAELAEANKPKPKAEKLFGIF